MMIKLLGRSGALWSRGRQGLGALSLALLQACAGGEVTHEPARHTYEQRYGDNGKLFGQDIVLVGGHSDDRGYEKTVVNPYMWRAAVEVLDTMGIEMASSKTGMIETAWHAPEGSHGEEFKVIATVFCGTTRSTGVKVEAVGS